MVEEFEVITFRVPNAGSSAIYLILRDPADPKAREFPMDLKRITQLTPNPAYEKARSDQYYKAVKDEHDQAVNKATRNKAKRAKLYHNKPTLAAKPAHTSESSEKVATVLTSTIDKILEKVLNHLNSAVREQHEFFDQLEARQRENYQQLLVSQQSYFRDLLHVLKH